MGRRRALLLPSHATNDGARRLRLLLRKHSFSWIARRCRCDESTIRSWAREESKPGLQLRGVAREQLGIHDGAWDEAPTSERPDVYHGKEAEPTTTRRHPKTGASS